MSDWKTILSHSEARKYLDLLEFRNAYVDNRSNSVEVVFSCAKLLPGSAMDVIAHCLQGKFGGANMRATFRFDVGFEKEPERYYEYLGDYLLDRCPGLAPFIHAVKLEFLHSQATLRATVPGDFAYTVWKNSECTKALETLLHDSFNCPCRVACECGEPMTVAVDHARPALAPRAARPAQVAPKPDKPAQSKGATKQDGEKEYRLYGNPPKRSSTKSISALEELDERVCVTGTVCSLESKEVRGGTKAIILFTVTDFDDSIGCKIFCDAKPAAALLEKLSKGKRIKVYGNMYSDKFTNYELTLDCQAICALPPLPLRLDTCEDKRVELHLHTQMSSMDGLLSIKAAVETAKRWGHTALAVTDHGVVQSYPDFYSAAKKAGIKAIYGTEGYLLDDCAPIPMEGDFVALCVKATGIDGKYSNIVEIGAIKIINGQPGEKFSTFVRPHAPIPPRVSQLIGITDADVQDAPDIAAALKDFCEFAKGCVIVAHNNEFAWELTRRQAGESELEFDSPCVDTMVMASYLLHDELKSFKLSDVCPKFGIDYNKGRSGDEAEALAGVFAKLCAMLKEGGGSELPAVYPRHADRTTKEKNKSHHIVLLVKNQEGLTNLYKLISFSHLDFFYRRPRMPRSMLLMFQNGLIKGSACEAGELMRAVTSGVRHEVLVDIARFYDYLEIQPIGNNAFMVRKGTAQNDDELRGYNKTVVAISDELGIPCAATGDVHFLEPGDEVYRRVIMSSKGFDDADEQAPLYLKTTQEMLEEFSYLGEQKAREVVVEVPKVIAEQCEMLKPFPFETCQPIIEGAEEELVDSCHQKAHEIYGDVLPEPVQERLERELGSITKYGFSVLYVIARKLVLKSNADGYLVGSRGSVGSSLAAFMSGITEVNALAPHYICPNCKHSDFDIDLTQYQCGCDMPDKTCPQCGNEYAKDGFNIPFETFLGFEGDKVPDIDLNFSGEYQSVAHKYTETLFGEGYVFRAGTISGVQDKTAFGYVKKYSEVRGQTRRKCEIERIASGCCDVKRTTGQHPGGVVVVPKNRSVYEFTPLNHPADDKTSPITTHFDFASMHDTLVKLDILGHDDPTVIKMLQDLTGIDPQTVPLDDPETMSIFCDCDALGVTQKDLGSEVGTYGVPEFGTGFVRQMLVDTKPTTMEELVRIAGLSHGTDVWLNNAKDLVLDGSATLSQVICTRDDIMNFLILCGVDKKMSFTIMENVRKGKGLREDMEEAMKKSNVPAWYIESCKKIKYMFPRAHAVAYVMMSFRVAYFKVHHKRAFYAAYFTVRADEFDITKALGGAGEVKKRLKALYAATDLTDKEARQITILEVVLEMYLRGVELKNIDIMKSDATKFLIDETGALLPPVNAIAGLGDRAAQSLCQARQGGEFISQEDIANRAKINKTILEVMATSGVTSHLPETNQTTFNFG